MYISPDKNVSVKEKTLNIVLLLSCEREKYEIDTHYTTH